MQLEALRQKAEREQELLRQEQEAIRKKAELKANLNLLEAQKEATIAEAEARVLEYDESHDFSEQLPDQTEDPLSRVQDFVIKITKLWTHQIR